MSSGFFSPCPVQLFLPLVFLFQPIPFQCVPPVRLFTESPPPRGVPFLFPSQFFTFPLVFPLSFISSARRSSCLEGNQTVGVFSPADVQDGWMGGRGERVEVRLGARRKRVDLQLPGLKTRLEICLFPSQGCKPSRSRSQRELPF